MKPVRSSFPNALSPRRRRPSSVLVAACRSVAALPLSLSPLAAPWPPFRCPCRRLPSTPDHYTPTGFDRRGMTEKYVSPVERHIPIYTHTRHTAAPKGRGALTSLRPSRSRRCCGPSSEYVRPPTAPDPFDVIGEVPTPSNLG